MRHKLRTSHINCSEVIVLEKRWKRTLRSWVYLETYLHLCGNRELRVENCTKILEYNDVLVRLQTRDMVVEIWGTDLRVFDYNDSSVIVRGSVTSIQLAEQR